MRVNYQAEHRVDGFLDSLTTYLEPKTTQSETTDGRPELESNLLLFPGHLPTDEAIAVSLGPQPTSHPSSSPSLPTTAPNSLTLDQSLDALLDMIAPEHSRAETVSALRQVVDLLSDDTVEKTATQAELQQLNEQLNQRYDELQGQLHRLESQVKAQPAIAPVEEPAPPDPPSTPSPSPEPTPPTPLAATPTLEQSDRPTQPDLKKPRPLWIGLILTGLILIPWGSYHYLTRHQRQLQHHLNQAIAANPDLSLYRLTATVQGRTITLRGTIPDRAIQTTLNDLSQNLAPKHTIADQIIVIDTPVIAALQDLTTTINTLDGTTIQAQFNGGHVILTGTAPSTDDRAVIQKQFAELAGVLSVDNQITVQPLSIATRLYFGQNSATVQTTDHSAKLLPLKQFLQQHPRLKVKIIGYSHTSETQPRAIAQARAQTVQTLLEDHGIDRRRLLVAAGPDTPPNVQPSQDRWLHRTVIFELIAPDSPTSPSAQPLNPPQDSR